MAERHEAHHLTVDDRGLEPEYAAGTIGEIANRHGGLEVDREVTDILDDLDRMVVEWEELARKTYSHHSTVRSTNYANAGCTRDAARLIRVLVRKLEEGRPFKDGWL